MTNAETFIVLQTLWDVFLIALACGIACYWWVFWLLVLNDEPLNVQGDSLTVKLISKCRELRGQKEK
jgi:hypothetical protein